MLTTIVNWNNHVLEVFKPGYLGWPEVPSILEDNCAE